MTKVRALFDTVGYYVADDPRPRYASKGEEFELDGEQLKRHLEHGSVEKASSRSSSPAPDKPLGEMTKAELQARAAELGVDVKRRANADELVAAIVAQAPGATQPQPQAPPEQDPDAVAPGVDPDDLRTPALDPVGDGKTDQSEIEGGESATGKAVG